jgi:heme/copper-type cytochrome/quinol oxidase subunit 2
MSVDATGPTPPPAGGALRSLEGLATALAALLAVGAVVDVLSFGFSLFTWMLMRDYLADPASVDADSVNLSDTVIIAIGVAQLVLYLATIVVFLVWFHRVRSNGQVFRPDGFTQSPGWAIGGWFVPIANLFFPYRTARETWEASSPYAPDGSHSHVSTAPVTAWWLVFLASEFLDRISTKMYTASDTPEELRDASALGAVASLTCVVSAVLAIRFVRKLTALQRAKAEQRLVGVL